MNKYVEHIKQAGLMDGVKKVAVPKGGIGFENFLEVEKTVGQKAALGVETFLEKNINRAAHAVAGIPGSVRRNKLASGVMFGAGAIAGNALSKKK